MATNPYPKITAKAWATLRTRAAASPTVRFTPDMVAALMTMSTKSARDNVVRPMRRLGLIDEENTLTDRGSKWRIDSSLGDACQEILDEIYPAELGALIDDDGRPDSEMVKSWFENQGFGIANARKMTATYVMIASEQVSELAGTGPAKAKKKASPATKPTRKSPEPQDTEKPHEGGSRGPPAPPVKSSGGPTVHLNIQIHIPADATLEQIDGIFSSIARHLYAK